MRSVRQRGVALLAVSLLLVIVGALAYMMSRQGAMAANTVDAQYDAEAARYLAEAGWNVAKWRDQQVGCKKDDTLVKPSRIDASGTYSAFIKEGDKQFDIDAVGVTSAGGARISLTRKNVIAHENILRQMTLGSDKGEDTFISSSAPLVAQHSRRYLELTQGSSSVLMQFDLPGELSKAIVVKAVLTMTQSQSNTVLKDQVVSVHRVTRKWDPDWATWLGARLLVPWSSTGADYTPATVAATTIDGDKPYSWDITALVDGWANNAFSNYGLLLRADGALQQAQFNGFQSASNRPTLLISFYKAC